MQYTRDIILQIVKSFIDLILLQAAGTSKGVKRGSDGEAVTSEPKHPSYKGKEKVCNTYTN